MKDFHLHSTFSFDGTSSIENYLEFADKNNYLAICFTEHDELLEITDNFQNYIDAIKKNSSQYKTTLYAGIEAEINNLTDIENNTYDKLDFILCSFHQNSKTPIDYYINFFDLLNDESIFDRFDAIAHLDFPLRYNDFAINFFQYFSNISFVYIEKILQKLAKKEKALEINIENFLGKNKEISLKFWKNIIDIFKKNGGLYFTYGSDSHSLNNFMNSTKIRKSIIESLGLNESDFVIFDNHKII